VIVCGLGQIGYRVVRALDLMRPRPRIVLVYQRGDTDPELVEEAGAMLAELVEGDARLEAILRRAGLGRACAVIAATSDDLTNMQIGLAARRHAPDIDLALRVYNEDLAERLETLFGIHTTFSIPALAAPTLSAAAIVPGVSYAIEVAEQIYSTTVLRVGQGSPFRGYTVEQLRERAGILALAVHRGGLQIPAKLETELCAGDQVAALVAIGRLDRLRAQPGALDEPAG
jgi:Trk K+ transport system NAD-binding subunit